MHNRTLLVWMTVFGTVAGAHILSASDAVVGTGTPASCTESALDAALLAVTTGGGNLSFACGAAPHTILVTSEKVVFGEVTLDGGGRITLSGGNGARILHVLTPAFVFVQGVHFTHGFSGAAAGGAIFVDGTGAIGDTRFSLHDSTVRDSISGAWGGGIAANNATLSLVLSSVSGNEAAGGGGGINLNNGLLQLIGSEVADNLAGGSGGGLEFWTGELYVDDSTFARNVAENALNPCSGGGLALRDLAIASIESSRIFGNRSDLLGGGLYVWGTTGLLLSETEIDDNEAVDGVGGGLRLAFPAEVDAQNVTFAGNRAVQGGAIDSTGPLRLANATLSGNVASGGGGGAILADGDLELTHVTIAGNTAAIGGGLWSGGVSGTITNLKNVLFSVNAAGASPDCHFDQAPDSLTFSLWPGTSCGASTTFGNQPNTVLALPRLAISCSAPSQPELTATHELPAGSAAVDTGGCVLPDLASDQRGVARPQGSGCDKGSVERSGPSCNGLFLDGFEGASTYRWSAAAR